MMKIAFATLILTATTLCAQFEAFEVATIKPTPPNTSGRYTRMQGGHQFVAKNFSIRYLVGAAYNLNPRMISGGPEWIDSDHYDILAATPGEKQPSVDQQMVMLQKLLADRVKLTFHREPREMPIYALTVAKTGSKLQASTAPPEDQPNVTSTVYPAASGGIDHVLMPAHNATMAQFASVLQRAILDRPVVDQTGLTGQYDFNLEWAPDETQFDGNLPPGVPDHPEPDLFTAVQQQLGLRLEKTRGPALALVIDHVERPSAN
jgi:uncharacterized protein (TIGR03435 family)